MIEPAVPLQPASQLPQHGSNERTLVVRDLRVSYGSPKGATEVVHGIDLGLRPGETLGLVGESGSGKSTVVLAIARLLGRGSEVGGEVLFEGTDLTRLRGRELRQLLGAEIGVVYQDALRSLNPVMRVGAQLRELIRTHLPEADSHAMAVSLLGEVGIPTPAERQRLYPHQLSGGMRQRVLIAMGLGLHPRLLLADEPTTALDVTIQAQVLELISRLASDSQTATLLVTHDMGVVARMCDRVAVMYAGRIVEEGPTSTVFKDPRHPYTVSLLGAVPRLDSRPGTPYLVIPGTPLGADTDVTGCPFAARCYAAEDRCRTERPALLDVATGHQAACLLTQAHRGRQAPPPPLREEAIELPAKNEDRERRVLLEARQLRRTYAGRAAPFRPRQRAVQAVDGIDLQVYAGETLALVGESGCGKSTLGRLLSGLEAPDEGTVLYDGLDVTHLQGKRLRRHRQRVQMIYQDPRSSLNRRMSLGDTVFEALARAGAPPRQRLRRAVELFELVGLPSTYLRRYPNELSGGEAQRAAIARAIAVKPDVVIADEAVSSLDVSIKGQILNLLYRLRRELGMTVVFISHDLAVVRQVSDRAAVMYRGAIIELGPTEDLFTKPQHPYTVALRSAIPIPDPEVERRRHRIVLQGDSDTTDGSPAGCRFRLRCPVGPIARPDRAVCESEEPHLESRSGVTAHVAACHFASTVAQELSDR